MDHVSFYLDLENSKASPVDRIYTHEFIEGILKLGSLISMLEGKKVNVTTLFLLILSNTNYQKMFVELTAANNLKEAIFSLLCLHPTLVKSKFTKSFIKKANISTNDSPNSTRKASLQHTPRRVAIRKRKAVQAKKTVQRPRGHGKASVPKKTRQSNNKASRN